MLENWFMTPVWLCRKPSPPCVQKLAGISGFAFNTEEKLRGQTLVT
jgi:hypothetical protein